MARYYHSVQSHITGKMQNNRNRPVANKNYMRFNTNDSEGTLVRENLTLTPQKYLCDENDLRKAAPVTDKLRAVFERLQHFDRNSMRGAVCRIMNEPETQSKIRAFFEEHKDGTNISPEDEDNKNDDLVSILQQCII